MTERIFTYQWSDAKRLTVLHALGFMYAKLQTAPPAVSESVLGLISELSTTPGRDAEPRSGTETARANAAASAYSPTDYFARNKRGDTPATPPEGAELSTVRVVSAQKSAKPGKAPHLKVIFAAGVTADQKVRPAGQANCFDDQLWPLITKREGQQAQLWILESGNYLNIVGVRE